MRVEAPQVADLPDRKLSFWRMTGPGAVMVGLSIGAGELIIWPRITAQYGASMVWVAVLGVFLQLWVNFEVGRWTIATGESPYAAFSRLWGGFAGLFILLNVAGWIAPGWARAAGTALKALVLSPDHPSPDWLWTGITCAGVAVVLFGPRRVNIAVERTVTALVVVITLGLLYIALRIGTVANIRTMLGGMMNIGFREPGFSVKAFFIALVFAGAGGTANLFYAYYLRDKQIGMGGRIPVLENPLRGRHEATARVGYTYPESPENARRFRDWYRFVVQDQTIYFWGLNTFTILLFIFGALAVLFPLGIVPGQGTLVFDEAAILAETLGPGGRTLFIVIGFATLFSTQIALVDGLARTLADLLGTSYRFARGIDPSRLYGWLAAGILALGVVITFVMERAGITDLGFLFNAAYMGGFAMAVYTPLLLYVNLRHLPPSARPRWPNIAMMLVASLVYGGFAIYCLIDEIAKGVTG